MNELVPFSMVGAILLGCESCQPFFEHIYAQWIDRSHANVDSEVEFVPIDQQWVRDVARND